MDGFAVILSPGWSADAGLLTQAHELPTVVIDRTVPRRVDEVLRDRGRGSAALVEHLIGHGHRRIALIRGAAGLSTTVEQEAGCRQAHADHGLPVDEALIADGALSANGGAEAVERLLSLPVPPTAAFSANNNMMLGAVSQLRKLGCTVPDHLAFVAFDDLEWSEIVQPGIHLYGATVLCDGHANVRVAAGSDDESAARGPDGAPAAVV